MQIRFFAAAATLLLVAASCSSAESSRDETSASSEPATADGEPITAPSNSAAYEALAALPVACGGTLPEPPASKQYNQAEDQGIGADQTVTATITTSCGDLVLTLDPAAAPATVNNFVFLAREGYYDGIVSHRIAPGFVLQIGDPTAVGDGGPGYSFDDELPASTDEYVLGSVVMANAGPNTNGSQIFINLVDNSRSLDPLYSKFGELTAGQEVLDKIAAVPTGGPQGQTPLEGVFIEGIVIEIT